MTPGGAEETPWAAVQRLRAEGLSYKAIAQKLREGGTSEDDLGALFQDIPEARDAVVKPAAAAKGEVFGPNSASLFRWAAMAISLFGAFASVMAVAAGYPLGFAALAVTLGVLIALFVTEVRAAPRRTARRLGGMLVLSVIVPTIVAAAGAFNGWWAGILAIGLSGIPLFAWGSMRRGLRGIKDELKVQQVFESNGVQFVFGLPKDEQLPAGGYFVIRLITQNVLDVPRSLVMRCYPRPRMIVEPEEVNLELKPGFIEEHTFAFRLLEDEARTVTLVFDVHGLGDREGHRLRDDEGIAYEPRDEQDVLLSNLAGIATLGVIGIGLFRFGTMGITTVKIVPSLPATPEPPRPSTRVLWSAPDFEVKRAAKG